MNKLYTSATHGYVLELWGSSTKHPDTVFYFDQFTKSDFFSDKSQVFQWLLECASKLTWPMHAKEIADMAIEDWYPLSDKWSEPTLPEWSTDHWHPNYR